MGIIDRDHGSYFHDDKTFELDGIGQQKGFENIDDELDSLLEHSAPNSPLSSNADTATSDSDAGRYRARAAAPHRQGSLRHHGRRLRALRRRAPC